MKKRNVAMIPGIAVICVVCWLACAERAGGGSTEPISLAPVFSDGDLAARFGSYYRPISIDVVPQVPSYPLPLVEGDIQNLNDVMAKLFGVQGAKGKLHSVAKTMWPRCTTRSRKWRYLYS